MKSLRGLALILLVVALTVAAQRNRRGEAGYFHTDVPAHLFDITLGRPEDRSVTATTVAYEPIEGFFESASFRTSARPFAQGEPVSVRIEGLRPDTRYTYWLRYRRPGGASFQKSPDYEFHTQRAAGSAFTFAVQADSHLDENTAPDTYVKTLMNISESRPDFLVDLGDTFMTDKRRGDFRAARPQYLAQRYYFGLAAHSAPLLMALGNHDGEGGARHDGSRDSMAAWSHTLRTRLFPNPRPDAFYSGNMESDAVLGPLENYYAFTWGSALFAVLDPFWPTASQARGDLWRWTLGEAQYRWLARTLAGSRARFKFVFLHHPIGARTEPVRGGIEAARYGEWGGLEANGSPGFAKRRPGWGDPVHRLLVKAGVTIVFHGHDHFYAREELDGVVYQLVPQPGNPRSSAVPRNAEEYGYTSGIRLGGSGYLRVDTDPQSVSVSYVSPSKAVLHSYRLAAR